MKDNKPEEIRFGACYSVSKHEFLNYPDRVRAIAEARLREEMAHVLQREKREEIEDDERFEVRLEIYAATPKKFWEIVNREAEKIAIRFMPTPKKEEHGGKE